jgi:hypothetical protein
MCHAVPPCYLFPPLLRISLCLVFWCLHFKLGAHWTMRPSGFLPTGSTRPAEGGLTGDPLLPEALEETPKHKANKSLYLYVTASPIDPFLYSIGSSIVTLWSFCPSLKVLP